MAVAKDTRRFCPPLKTHLKYSHLFSEYVENKYLKSWMQLFSGGKSRKVDKNLIWLCLIVELIP